MKLRGRLLLVSGTVVALPLLGLQFVGSVERMLRGGLEQTTLDAARALATVAPRPEAGDGGPPALYVQESAQPLLLDGYGDDWAAWLQTAERLGPDGREAVGPGAVPTPRAPGLLVLAASPAGLNLLLRVHDERTRFSRAPDAPGDAIEIVFESGGRSGRVELAPAAPGRFVRTGSPADWPTVIGQWQVHADGWSVEMRIPSRERPDRLGLMVVDRDTEGGATRRFGIGEAVPLLRRDPALSAALAELAPADLGVWLVSPAGYVLGHAARSAASRDPAVEPTRLQAMLFERLAAGALSKRGPGPSDQVRLVGPALASARAGRPQPTWRIERGGARAGARLRAAVPLDPGRPDGALLVVERDADAVMLLASDAVVRLAGASLLTFVAAAGVVLAFATWLSLRIRRLQRAAEEAVGDEGRVTGALKPVAGDDEVAVLSRSMASLLERLRVHQQYLRTLADRLAHELRTPLAMIGSSLDNLGEQFERDGCPEPAEARRYLDRAGEGSRRLQRILRAMSQADRLEDALIDEPFERFDLAALVREYCEARSAGLSGLAFQDPERELIVRGSPDLLAQLLDKLFDNAVDFTPPGGGIRVDIAARDARAVLMVDNDGPSVAAEQAQSMFEPMVSHRDARGDQPHLGMGLFVARLIAERHGGRVRLEPVDGGTRAVFEMPLAGDPPR